MRSIRYNQTVLTILFLCFLIPPARAAEPYFPQVNNPLAESWRWKNFPELEGKGVSRIMEGPDHRVWVSCNNGIYEYNGYDWTLHNAANGLSALPVRQVLAAKDGQVYATTQAGIFRYNGDRWTTIFSIPTSLDFVFFQIKELTDGSIMACSSQGVLHFSKKQTPQFYSTSKKIAELAPYMSGVHWIHLPEALDDGLGFMDISDVLEDRTGKFWFAVTMPGEVGRLFRFRLPKTTQSKVTDYELIVSDAQIKLGETQKMIEAQDGTIWVVNSTYKTGIVVFNGTQRQYIKLSDYFGGDEFTTEIVQSSDGTIWIGSLGKLYACKNGRWKSYSAPSYFIPANGLMLQTSEGNKLWVAGYKANVFLLDFSTDCWMTYANLNFQCETPNGEKWFLEASGKVVRQKGNNWTAFGVADGLMDAPIRLIVTSKGQLWAAGSHQGTAATAVLKTNGWLRQTHPNLSWGIDYRAVFEAADGSLWFGGAVDNELDQGQLGGLIQLTNPEQAALNWVPHIYFQNGLIQSNCYGIGQSRDGRLWIGGSSLFFYDGKTWQQTANKQLQQPVNIVCSSSKWLIAGSRYYGIFIFDGQVWKNYNTSNGLSSNTIISIDIVSDKCILVATENGICRFDGETWVRHIFPAELTMDFEGGMLLHDHQGAIWISKSSRSWKRRAFKHSKKQEGLSQNFATYRYIPDDIPPETTITFFDGEVSSDGNTLIKWSGKDYFAQSAAERLTFSWRLNGGDWSAFNSENHNTFISLPSGRYTLEVRARDLDLNIDPSPAVAYFKVQPPVWKQGWFILLLLTFLIVVGIYEYQLITKKQKLEKVNSSLHLANKNLKDKGDKIETQNQEILAQQEKILAQSNTLQTSNNELEKRNLEIEYQRDMLEEMVVQVKKLSTAQLRFFTNISHEFRTPLTLITGPIEQLLNSSDNLSPAERQRMYGIVERNASRLLKLINQLLEIRRLEQTTPEPNFQNLCLPDYICGIVKLFENLADKQDIHLVFNNHCGNEISAVDPDKTEKIIVNLLSNAFKHTPKGGNITLSLGIVLAQASKLSPLYNRYFEIRVEDTGSGIQPEDLEHIFDRYFSSGIDKTGPKSSGIGLAYTKDLVNVLQGSIKVESVVNRGSKFFVYLPFEHLEQVQTAEKHQIKSMPNQLAREEARLLHATFDSRKDEPGLEEKTNLPLPRILIVEDNPDMQEFLEGILCAKYQVLKAENGRAGLLSAQKHTVDLIISDVMMPEMDGFVFCKKIKSDPATCHIPVVLLTAKTLDENKATGYREGADDYIAKPFNPGLLEVRVESLLKQREQLREVYSRDFLLRPKEVHLTSFDEEFLKKLTTMMEENLEETEFNVNKMCEMLHLSHMHFIRKVKQLTGQKPIDLLKSFRLKRAKDLLKQNKLTVSEIAYKVGYDLPNSFSRAFKKEFGISPTEYVE